MSGWETPLSARKTRGKRSMYPPSPMSGTPVNKSMEVTPPSSIKRRATNVPPSSSSPRPMSVTPGSPSPRLMSEKSHGTVLGIGTFACVVAGNLCNPSRSYSYNMVSKVVKNDTEIATIDRITNQLQGIPKLIKNNPIKWEDVIIHPSNVCSIDNIPSECKSENKDELIDFKNDPPFTVYVMPQGIPLVTYLSYNIQNKTLIYDTVSTCLRNYIQLFHILDTIPKTGDIRWIHGDINENNIVIIQSNGKIEARLIDYNPYSKLLKSADKDSDMKGITKVLIYILGTFGMRGYNENDTTLNAKSFTEINTDYLASEKAKQQEQKKREREKGEAIKRGDQPTSRRITFNFSP